MARAPTDDELARLLRTLADAVVVADRDGRIVFWNDAATRVFGWTAASALGRSLDLIIPGRFRDRHWAGYRRVMETGRTEYADRLLEVPAEHSDGRRLSIAFTVSMLWSPDGSEVLGIAAVIRDVTRQWEQGRRLRKDLEELRDRVEAG